MSVQFPVVLAPMENRLSRGLAVLVYLLLLGVTNPYTFKVRNIELIGLGSSLACGNLALIYLHFVFFSATERFQKIYLVKLSIRSCLDCS